MIKVDYMEDLIIFNSYEDITKDINQHIVKARIEELDNLVPTKEIEERIAELKEILKEVNGLLKEGK